MKKNYFFILILFVFANTGKKIYAQCNYNDPTILALPKMFVAKGVSDDMKVEFFSPPSKYQKLLDKNKYQDIVLSYPKTAFDQLLTKIGIYDEIGVYFARYTSCSGVTMPGNLKENQVIILFAPEKLDVIPTEYFFINDKDVNVYNVNRSCAEAWIRNYFDNNQPDLRQTIIDPSYLDHKDPHSPVGYSDTKAIFYDKKDFKTAFIGEPTYQRAKHGIDITGYQITFCSNTKRGNFKKPFNKHRLMILFDYLYDNQTQVLNIEGQFDYVCRKKKRDAEINSEKKLIVKGKFRRKGIDNGQLCPTYCPR
jgi:hypothetical protein